MNIGFVGVPPLDLIEKYKGSFPRAQWFDLDVPRKEINKKTNF